jgi:3-oxoacyl-[acyl-carrier-protein] synthase II
LRVAINGIGVVGGFGCGVEALHRCLLGIEPPPVARPADVSFADARWPFFFAADTSDLKSFVSKNMVRRLDHFARLAALAAFLALQDAGLPIDLDKKTGVVVASGYGASQSTFSFLDTVIDDGDICASPTFFSNSIHNAAAAHISILTRANGPSITISQFKMSIPMGLLTACKVLEEKKADIVLFGGVDEACPALLYSWSQLFSPPCPPLIRPFELKRHTAVPGEGAVFFVLSRGGPKPAKYGTVMDVTLGNERTDMTRFFDETPLILGLDGHSDCNRHYAQQVPIGCRVAAYSYLYGSLPVGPGFALAVAALALSENRLYGVRGSVGDYRKWRIIREDQAIGDSSISCIQFDCHGYYGAIKLAH